MKFSKVLLLVKVCIVLLGTLVAQTHKNKAEKPNAPVVTSAPKATLTCSNNALHCASLNWTASTSGNPTGYNVYRSLTSGGCSTVTASGCTKINSTPVTTTSFMDSPLQATTTYNYVVTALNGSGESGPSNQFSGTTGQDPAPSAPTGLTGTIQ